MSEGSAPARPSAVTALAWLDLSCAALALGATVAATLLARTLEPSRAAMLLGAGAAFVTLALLLLVAGIGLLRVQPYGRYTQIAVALCVLPVAPFGTLFAAAMLSWLLKPGARALFRAGHEHGAGLTRDEAGMLTAGTIVGAASAVVLAAALAVALAIPLVRQRRRTAAEVAALADVRAVMAAQAAYAQANGGRFDRLECLADPPACLAGDDARAGRPFLEASLLERGERHGYVFSFHAGPPPAWDDERQGVSPSSMSAFAYVAAPGDPATARWFCADATGRVCAVRRPEPPAPWNGVCPADCEAVP